VPLFFSGFWSKDAILDAASHWSVSRVPFYLGLFGAFLTAFYMTRQVCRVFFGKPASEEAEQAHESPPVMTVPLMILAGLAVVAGFLGTPAWPWFQSYLEGGTSGFDLSKLTNEHELTVMLLSSVVVITAIVLGARIYGRGAQDTDPLETAQPAIFACLQRKFYVDELYDATVVRLTKAFALFCDWLDRVIFGGLVQLFCWVALVLAWLDREVDDAVVNGGFDLGSETVRESGRWVSRWQNGQVQRYLRIIGLGFGGLIILLLWRSA
jgi:NADH-quinone oxidoreductase subunit L